MRIMKLSEKKNNSNKMYVNESTLTMVYSEKAVDKIIKKYAEKLESLDIWVEKEEYFEGRIITTDGFAGTCFIEDPEPVAFNDIDTIEKVHASFEEFFKLLMESFTEEAWLKDLYNEIVSVKKGKCTGKIAYVVNEPAEYWTKDKILIDDIDRAQGADDEDWESFYARIPESDGLLRAFDTDFDGNGCETFYFSELQEMEKKYMIYEIDCSLGDNNDTVDISDLMRKPTSYVRETYKKEIGHEFDFCEKECQRIREMLRNCD